MMTSRSSAYRRTETLGDAVFIHLIIRETNIAKRTGDRGQHCLIPEVGQMRLFRHTPPLTIKAIGLLKRFKSKQTNSGGSPLTVKKAEAYWWVTESYALAKSMNRKAPSVMSCQDPKALYRWSCICLPLMNPFCSVGVRWEMMSDICNAIHDEIHFRLLFCGTKGRKSFAYGVEATLGIGLSKARDRV